MDTQNPESSSLPNDSEPNPKRLKLPTTATTDDTATATATATTLSKPPTYRRRKIALIFAYCGAGYQGMQKNPGAKTIEGDLQEALYQSSAVPESDRSHPRNYDWFRSARTDKGVSAVGQVASGRFFIDPPGFIARLNSNLPAQTRVFGFKRVTGSFNAQKFCDRRRYVYLIPVFALDGRAHCHEICFECSGKGRSFVRGASNRACNLKNGKDGGVGQSGILSNKIENKEECVSFMNNEDGVVGQSGILLNKLENQEDVTFGNNGDGVVCQSGILLSKFENKEECVSFVNNGDGVVGQSGLLSNKLENEDEFVGFGDNGDGVVGQSSILLNKLENKDECASLLGNDVDDGGLNGDGEVMEVKKGEFCYGEKERERFNRVLGCYVGTHNFHNFTSRITAQDPSAKRYIVSFNAEATVNVDGIEFVKCEVVGQSFLLHQIRKMIGLAVVIMRGIAPETLIETAFRKDVKINVPVAPEVGLYLDECFFSPYNRKWKDSHEEVSMKSYTEEAEAFKMKYIYPHIASTEHKDGTVALWLHYLNHDNYPDLRIDTKSKEENVEPQNLVMKSNNRSSSGVKSEVENACLEVNRSSGSNVSAENIVVKDIQAGGDGNIDIQNVEVKDMDQ